MDQFSAHLDRGWDLVQRGDAYGAEHSARRALELNGESPEAYNLLGYAAGDMPYSIEAVPYVMYFHKSYAVHGAFWHENFGVKMSHGCINMAPLDAKYVFFHTDPPVRQGWQGAWSSDERVGSLVVVHE